MVCSFTVPQLSQPSASKDSIPPPEEKYHDDMGVTITDIESSDKDLQLVDDSTEAWTQLR